MGVFCKEAVRMFFKSKPPAVFRKDSSTRQFREKKGRNRPTPRNSIFTKKWYFARLLFYCEYGHGFAYPMLVLIKDSFHLATRYNFQWCVLIFLIKMTFVARYECAAVSWKKIRLNPPNRTPKTNTERGQHYWRETTANRNVQSQRLTRTNDKITLNRRESGNPFLSWNKRQRFAAAVILTKLIPVFSVPIVGGLMITGPL